jgi:hypothetical protein
VTWQAATDQLEYHCFMGIFPEIRRAWMTIDHIFFLWDYTDPRGSFYQYDGLDQVLARIWTNAPVCVLPPAVDRGVLVCHGVLS